jgi:hypothetical protein
VDFRGDVKELNRLGDQVVVGVTDDADLGKIAERKFGFEVDAAVYVGGVGFAAGDEVAAAQGTPHPGPLPWEGRGRRAERYR